MKKITTYKFKCFPSPMQQEKIKKDTHSKRVAWNELIRYAIQVHDSTDSFPSAFDMGKYLVKLKTTEKFSWFKNSSCFIFEKLSTEMDNTLYLLTKTVEYKNAKKYVEWLRTKNGTAPVEQPPVDHIKNNKVNVVNLSGFPHIKNKNSPTNSINIRIHTANKKDKLIYSPTELSGVTSKDKHYFKVVGSLKTTDVFYWENNRKSMTFIPFIMHRQLPVNCDICEYKISYDKFNNWYLCIVTSVVDDAPIASAFSNSEIVGVDMGLTHAVITSLPVVFNGKLTNKIDRIKFDKLIHKKYKKLSRKLARKSVGSNKFNAIKYKMGKIKQKSTRYRDWYTNGFTKAIADRYLLIGLEKLSIKNMMKNHKLAGNISDVAWFDVKLKLQYKVEQRGGKTVEAYKTFPSTKISSKTGFINKKLTLKDREWVDDEGNLLDRDINAAQNLAQYAKFYVESGDNKYIKIKDYCSKIKESNCK